MFKFSELFELLKEQLGKTFLLVGLLPALLLMFGYAWIQDHDATPTSKILEDFAETEGIGARGTYWILSALVLSLTVPGLLRWLMDTPDRWGVGARRKERVNAGQERAKFVSGFLDSLNCSEDRSKKANLGFFLERCLAEVKLAVFPLSALSSLAKEALNVKKEEPALRRLLRKHGGLKTLQTRAWAESERQQRMASFLPDTPRTFHVGNLAAKLEEYAVPRYGMDSTTLWPRLAVGLKPEEEQRLSGPKLRATACLSCAVVITVLFWIFVARETMQILALSPDWSEWLFLGLLVASALMCWSGMTLGVRNLVTETRTLIDLRWHTLFGSLGFNRPESFFEAKLAMRVIKDFLTDGDNHLDPSRLGPLAPKLQLSRLLAERDQGTQQSLPQSEHEAPVGDEAPRQQEAHAGPGLEQYQVIVHGSRPFKSTTVHLDTTVGHFSPATPGDEDGKRTKDLEIEMDAVAWTSPETSPPSEWTGRASFYLDMMGAHKGGAVTANWQGAQSRVPIPPAKTQLAIKFVVSPSEESRSDRRDYVLKPEDVFDYSHVWVEITGSSSYPIAVGELVRTTVSKRREHVGTAAVLTEELQIHSDSAAHQRWTVRAQLPIPDGPGPALLEAEWAGARAECTIGGNGDPLALLLKDKSASPQSLHRTLRLTLNAPGRFHGNACIWIKGGSLARMPDGGAAVTIPIPEWTRAGEEWTTALELSVMRKDASIPLLLEAAVGTFRAHFVDAPSSAVEAGGQKG